MEEIYEKGMIPIVTGGTGFYIQALLYDIDFTESSEDTGYRKELADFADRYGEEALHAKLRKVDERRLKRSIRITGNGNSCAGVLSSDRTENLRTQ